MFHGWLAIHCIPVAYVKSAPQPIYTAKYFLKVMRNPRNCEHKMNRVSRLRNGSYNHLIDLRSHPRIVLSLAVAICDPPWCGFQAPVVKRGWPLPSKTVVSISWRGNVWIIRCVMTYWVTYGHRAISIYTVRLVRWEFLDLLYPKSIAAIRWPYLTSLEMN